MHNEPSKIDSNLANLMVINYEMDENSQVFAHQFEVVRRLAEKFERVIVVTTKLGLGSVPANVTVIVSKWIPGQRFLNTFRFLFHFLGVLIKTRKLVIFSHMTEVQSAIISPLTRLMGIKHVIWYAHKSKSFAMNLNQLTLNRILTSTSGSCPYRGSKVQTIGQGIDKTEFEYKQHYLDLPIKLIHVGRLDPSKKIEDLISVARKMHELGNVAELAFAGAPSGTRYNKYSDSLRKLVVDVGAEKWITFQGPIKRSEISTLLEKFDVFIHGFEGSLDKALVEATFCGIPVVTRNGEYRRIFGNWTGRTDSSLEDEMLSLFDLSQSERNLEIERRYRIAERNHSLEGWVEEITRYLISRD